MEAGFEGTSGKASFLEQTNAVLLDCIRQLEAAPATAPVGGVGL